ncbi:myeloid leukemia factor 1 isoform X2 [Brachionus plicatilis]|uniref:Myeloid leukemia factor 1 isoform X2 n=1 Tax=Brachionus plicatilis TaxID=10195 RepID=A0A3M7SVI6_BRAPC|nr:myeloid leukemia factor 1 isoform X2 [Brachionus plicatilis]
MFDPFERMNSIMNQFMMDPFAQPGQRRANNQLTRRPDFMDPFAAMHNPFSMMGNFDSVFRNFEQMSNDPNSQVFSSSSVMTYSTGGDGKPKVFQKSKQIKQGPGGVRETREMVRDSEKNFEKMAIGHHIGQRAHVIERQKQNGQMEEIVNMENLDENEVQAFNEEFESRVRSQFGHSHKDYNRSHHLSSNQPLAIENSRGKR